MLTAPCNQGVNMLLGGRHYAVQGIHSFIQGSIDVKLHDRIRCSLDKLLTPSHAAKAHPFVCFLASAPLLLWEA